jgi:hypothetical protein
MKFVSFLINKDMTNKIIFPFKKSGITKKNCKVLFNMEHKCLFFFPALICIGITKKFVIYIKKTKQRKLNYILKIITFFLNLHDKIEDIKIEDFILDKELVEILI